MVIKLADRIIQIETIYPYTEKLCRDYVVDRPHGPDNPDNLDKPDNPDMDIVITEEDIEYERIKSTREDELEGRPVRTFPDDYLESLAVYRKIAEKLPCYDTFLFHGSALEVDGEGYIFTASSGTGKSTHAGLWRQVLGDRVIMINDDKPLIRVTEDRAFVYGTPWDGKHRLSTNTNVPIKAVCILERGANNSIELITGEDALPMLIQQTYRPADPAAMAVTLKLIDRMASCVKLYRMKCTMDPEAAILSYTTMSQTGRKETQ